MSPSPGVVLPLLLWRRGLGRGGPSAHLPRWNARALGQAWSCLSGRLLSLRTTASSPWPSPPKEERETAPRGTRDLGSSTTAYELRVGCTHRARLGVWTLLSGQPGGLPEGSRRSPGVFWGRRPPGNGLEDVLHPGRGARVVAPRASVWHPSGVHEPKTRFPVVVPPLAPNDHRLPSTNPPGWPRPKSSAENVTTPGRARRDAPYLPKP